MNYGISNNDLRFQQQKIDKQIDYMESNSYLTSNGQLKSLRELSMSANISPRYYAQLVNKVNTLQQTMTNEDLVPCFLTITLDGVYHDLLTGNYSRFTDLHLQKLPENDRFDNLQTKAISRVPFTVRDLYKLLRFQWKNILDSRVWKSMKKEGFKVGYLFAVEPHKSGCPHAHVLLYLPKKYILALRDVFIQVCSAKQNTKQSKARLSPKQIKNGEINGFQWTLSNPVGYIMKYCTKSFMDLKNQTQIDELQAWYIKHKIIRITTSHTLVPQWVYNKIYPLESDWNYLTDLKLNSTCEWSKENNYFQFIDHNKNKTLRFDNGLYQMLIDDEIVDEFGEKKEKITLTCKKKLLPTIREKKRYIPIKIVVNGVETNFFQTIIPSRMKNYTLLNYYNSLNPENEDISLVHYGITQNECIKRGLIDGHIQSLNDFNTDIGA
jgi:hypothetical protein